MAEAPTTTTEVFVVHNVPTDVVMTAECLSTRVIDVPPLAESSVLLKVSHIGLEPYMRAFCISNPRAWPVGSVPSGKVVGEGVQSSSNRFAPGDVIKCNTKWRAYTWVAIDDKTLVERVDASVPPQIYLGLAGSGGRSAYLPLKHLARPQAGQTAVVTAAASCVGLAAVQLLALDGVRVAGSAGSDDKVALLKSLGCVAWNYKSEDAASALARVCPDGVDYLFDMVGGALRTAVLEKMNGGGQIVSLGSMAKTDGGAGHSSGGGEREEQLIAQMGLTNYSSNVNNYEAEFEACTAEIIGLYKAGKLVSKDTVVEGLENLPSAFVGIFKGANTGRMVVKVA